MARGAAIATIDHRSGLYDVSAGIVTSVSTFRGQPRHVRRGNNILFRPRRAFAVRSGSRNVTSASFATGPNEVPHSLARFYNAASPKLFAGTDDGTTRRIREVAAGAITTQSLPFTPSAELWASDMVGACLVMAQRGGTDKPIFYETTNPANTFHSIVLPTPGNTLTLADDATVGGLVAGTQYRWRIRWRFKNGSSVFSTPQAFTVGVGKSSVKVSTIPASSRSDYIGWTLERQKGGAAAAESYWVVNPAGTGAQHIDVTADADLFYRSDDGIHGEPPHLDGVIHKDGRLMGWAGSTVYVSQATGDLEATGPFNFHPQLAYVISTDDGDAIQVCLHQGDRLLVCKSGSLHALEGDSPLSYHPVAIYDGVGAFGLRAACSFGSLAFVYGSRGLHRISGNKVEPFGWDEVGEYLEKISLGDIGKVVLENVNNEFLLVNYLDNGGVYNTVVYDFRVGVWSHFLGWNFRDALTLKDGGFSNATLLFADPVARKIYVGFDGLLDGRNSDGTGGAAIPWRAEYPILDDGVPTTWKDYELLQVRLDGGSGQIAAAIDLGPDRPVQAVGLSYSSGGAHVQPATKFPLRTGPGSNAAYVYKVAGQRPALVEIALPLDTTGLSHALTLSGDCSDGLTVFGYELDGSLLPERKL